MGKIQDMANAVVGLGSSHRYVADESAKNQFTEVKHLKNLAWQIAGSGKGVNTSLKETVTGLGRILGQIDGQMTRQSKVSKRATSTRVLQLSTWETSRMEFRL